MRRVRPPLAISSKPAPNPEQTSQDQAKQASPDAALVTCVHCGYIIHIAHGAHRDLLRQVSSLRCPSCSKDATHKPSGA